MRGQNAVQKPHEMAKKDDHPDLAGLFPVTPALANGVIFTSVTQKYVFYVIIIDMYCLKTVTKRYCKLNNLTEISAS